MYSEFNFSKHPLCLYTVYEHLSEHTHAQNHGNKSDFLKDFFKQSYKIQKRYGYSIMI